MKCERCGQHEVRHEGALLMAESGANATSVLTYKGRNGILTANACDGCGKSLERLGWTKNKKGIAK